MKKKLLYVSPVMSRSGYGDHAREVARFLLTKQTEYDIRLAGTTWGSNPQTGLEADDALNKELSSLFLTESDSYDGCDVYIQLGLPPEFKPIGNFNIGITAGVETDKLGQSFIDGANRMDLIIVPSEFTKQTFLESVYTNKQHQNIRVTTPIEVVHEYADPSFYKNTSDAFCIPELDALDEDFCFLYVGQWTSSDADDGGRKNVNSLINSFVGAFHNQENKPALILKTSGVNFSVSDYIDTQEKIQSILNEHPNESQPSVYLLHGDFTPSEMFYIYNHPKVKAFATHTRGEGFGRPILEATLSGIPVLATKWSGHLDIIDKKHSVLLPGTLKPVGVVSDIFSESSSWMDVDNQFASDYMKKVVQNYDKYKQKALKLREINQEKFNPETINDTYNTALSKHIPS